MEKYTDEEKKHRLRRKVMILHENMSKLVSEVIKDDLFKVISKIC